MKKYKVVFTTDVDGGLVSNELEIFDVSLSDAINSIEYALESLNGIHDITSIDQLAWEPAQPETIGELIQAEMEKNHEE